MGVYVCFLTYGHSSTLALSETNFKVSDRTNELLTLFSFLYAPSVLFHFVLFSSSYTNSSIVYQKQR